MAGYSGTPLVNKIGIKAGNVVALVSPPHGFRQELVDLPERVRFSADGEDLDIIILFAPNRAALVPRIDAFAKKMKPEGMLWVGWPKKASGVATDLNENMVRAIGIAAGLVDIKVCAINDVWSGLKFVIPVKDRDARRSTKHH